MDMIMPENQQSNVMREKKMGNLVKISQASVNEGKEPASLSQSSLKEYNSTPHGSRGKTSS